LFIASRRAYDHDINILRHAAKAFLDKRRSELMTAEEAEGYRRLELAEVHVQTYIVRWIPMLNG